MRKNEPHDPIPKALAWLLAAILLFLLATPAFSQSVRLHDQAAVEGEQVLLGDVAELDDEAQDLADVVVGTFADGHTQMTLTLDGVRNTLQQSGQQVNWTFFTFNGYRSCDVRRMVKAEEPVVEEKATPVIANHHEPLTVTSHITVRDRVAAHLHQLNHTTGDELQVVFEERDQDYLRRAAFTGLWEVETLTRNTLGNVPLMVREYDQDGQLVAGHRLRADVSRRMLVVYTTREIKRGEVITPTLVTARETWVSDSRVKPISDLKAVIGLVASRNLRAAGIVENRDIEQLRVIRRGDRVTVTKIVGSMVLRTTGVAMQDGTQGDLIPVQNTQSLKEFTARVTARGQVSLDDEAMQVDRMKEAEIQAAKGKH